MKLWYIYTVEYCSTIKMKAFESVLVRWINLEPIIQTEVSQKEKDKYHILMHIYRINLLYLQGSIYSQDSNGEADIENRLMDMGRGEERVRYMERVTETYITICKIDSQWEFSVWLRKPKQGLCINLEGWIGREMEGSSNRRVYMYTYG